MSRGGGRIKFSMFGKVCGMHQHRSTGAGAVSGRNLACAFLLRSLFSGGIISLVWTITFGRKGTEKRFPWVKWKGWRRERERERERERDREREREREHDGTLILSFNFPWAVSCIPTDSSNRFNFRHCFSPIAVSIDSPLAFLPSKNSRTSSLHRRSCDTALGITAISLLRYSAFCVLLKLLSWILPTNGKSICSFFVNRDRVSRKHCRTVELSTTVTRYV